MYIFISKLTIIGPDNGLAPGWEWVFKVKSGICYISAKNGSIATKQKANISIER